MRGRVTYVPSAVFEELESIKRDLNMRETHKVFEEMARYSRVGREIEKIGTIVLPGYRARRKEDR